MEDTSKSYVPLYEIVDRETTSSSHTTGRDYAALKTEDVVQEDYQLPSVQTAYVPYPGSAENSDKVKVFERSLRRMQVVLGCGGAILCIVVILVGGIAIASVTSVRSNSKSIKNNGIASTNSTLTVDSLQQQVHALKESVQQLNSTRNASFFNRCHQESVTCNYTPVNNASWLMCKTDNLNAMKEVSKSVIRPARLYIARSL